MMNTDVGSLKANREKRQKSTNIIPTTFDLSEFLFHLLIFTSTLSFLSLSVKEENKDDGTFCSFILVYFVLVVYRRGPEGLGDLPMLLFTIFVWSKFCPVNWRDMWVSAHEKSATAHT